MKWWSQPVGFSDWRATPRMDFVTNVPAHRWYAGGEAGSYRPGGFDAFRQRVGAGDTVTVGVDYYGLFNMLDGMLPDQLRSAAATGWLQGGVLRLRAYTSDSLVVFEVW